MTCPWANIKQESINFKNILHEEISKDLPLKKSNKQYASNSKEIITETKLLYSPRDDNLNVQSDEMIAQLLQTEYDNEHCDELNKTELQIDGNSNISISLNNYRKAPLYNELENQEEEQENVDFIDLEDWDSFEEPLERYNCQTSSSAGSKESKCDLLLPLNLDFEENDVDQLKSKMPNRIFNELKLISNQKHSGKRTVDTKLDQSMVDICINQFINVLLHDMIHKVSLITVGKYAMIFHAYTKPSFPHSLPKECIVKVYKSTLSELIQLNKNVKDNHCEIDLNKFVKKRSIQIMAEKEKAVLMKLQKAGVKCPRVITLKSGILITTFIGKNKKTAPTLNEVVMSQEECRTAFYEINKTVQKMYKKNIIHSELSEHNILWYNKQWYIMDFGRCIEPTDQNAFAVLYKDCANINKFFRGKFFGASWSALNYMRTVTKLFEYTWPDSKTVRDYKQAFELRHKVKTI